MNVSGVMALARSMGRLVVNVVEVESIRIGLGNPERGRYI